jgi:hypothetical protein
MKKRMKIGLSIMMAGVAVSASATSITNAVDSSDGWTNIEGGAFSAGTGGLVPVAGSNFWTAAGSSNNRGAWKLFSDTFTDEVLEVTYSIGDRDDTTLPVPATYLFADINEDDTYEWGERILPTSTTRPVPTDNWAEWVDTYEINSSTQTGAGDLVLGKKIGFFFIKRLEGAGTGYAFDSLRIESPQAPDNLLIAWDTTSDDGGDYSSSGVTGKLFLNNAVKLDATAGSTDGTFGTLPGATNSLSAFVVRTIDPGTKDTVTFVIENTSASQYLDLDSISFDYSRWFTAGPTNVSLIYAYGNLGMTNGAPIFTATGIAETGKTGDYTDFDVTLTNLSNHVLEPGEKAAFKLIASGAGLETSSGAFDNIAILGAHFTMSYAYWDSTWGVDIGSQTNDYDNDGWDNLTEYGLGGNPTNGFTEGWGPYIANTVDGLVFLHGQHATDTSLTYYLETTADLVSPAWTNSGYSVTGTNVTGFSHNWVTNSIPTDDSQKFIRLIIEN